jgi:hypothetical protein
VSLDEKGRGVADDEPHQGGNPVPLPASLTRLPAGIPAVDKVRLDGIRFGLLTADLAYRRLVAVLEETSRSMPAPPDAVPGSRSPLFTAVILDAWSVVDSLNRLGQLLKELPRPYKTTPLGKLRLLTSPDLNDVRDMSQHLNENLKSLVDADAPVWGTVSWIWATAESLGNPDLNEAWAYSMTPGSVRNELAMDGSQMPTGYGVGIQHVMLESVRPKRSKVSPVSGPRLI